MRKGVWLAAGLILPVLLAVLAGCGPGAASAATAVARADTAFYETEKTDGLSVSLAIDPLKVGTNRLLVSLDRKDVAAVEAQVIMGTMGHGSVVDLTEVAPGKYEASSDVITMEGKWLIRIKATLTSGEEKDVLFQTVIKADK